MRQTTIPRYTVPAEKICDLLPRYGRGKVRGYRDFLFRAIRGGGGLCQHAAGGVAEGVVDAKGCETAVGGGRVGGGGGGWSVCGGFAEIAEPREVPGRQAVAAYRMNRVAMQGAVGVICWKRCGCSGVAEGQVGRVGESGISGCVLHVRERRL